MQVKDIRVGNWFMSKEFGVPVKLTLSDFGEADKHADGSNSDEWFNLNLSPIELTEEWLIKMGFEEEKGYYVRKFGVFTFAIYRVSSDEFNAPYLPFTTIKYLHHFQNIIHSLTENEI